jgi:hypothetical protein
LPLRSYDETATDYLKALPVEVWRDIFSRATARRLNLHNLANPIDISRRIDLEKITAAQIDLAEWLTICTSLLPIIEELLYEEVAFESHKSLKRFLKRASSRLPNGRNRGEWTMSIFYTVMVEVNPSTFVASCPNLKTLWVELDGWLPRGCWAGDWCRSIVALSYSTDNLNWNDLDLISTRCPQLIFFQLLGDEDYSEPVPAPGPGSIEFPQLQYFLSGRGELSKFNLKNIAFPSIRHLRFDSFGNELQYLVKQYGRRLTTLEISPLVIDQSDQEAIPKDLFNLCPLLERFIFPFDTTPPFDHPEAFTPHQWLDTLMLREHQNRYTFDNVVDLLIDHTSFFCEKNFPNVRLVIVELAAHHAITDMELLLAKKATIFPKANIKVYNDFHCHV